MTYRLLTCPETAHLELIEHIDCPLGTLILSCSRFRPPCELRCPRTCAARIDHGAHEIDDLIVSDTPDPTIALRIRKRVRRVRLG
jgi:hypothetical protein